MRGDAAAWWKQAQADLKTARDSVTNENYYAAAFFAQQASEKALKALLLEEERQPYIGHGLVAIAVDCARPKPSLARAPNSRRTTSARGILTPRSERRRRTTRARPPSVSCNWVRR